MNYFICVYGFLLYGYFDLENYYNSSLILSVYSALGYFINSQMYFYDIFITYLIYDMLKMLLIYFNREYFIHHLTALIYLSFRPVNYEFIRLIQMSEISSIFLNLTYVYFKENIFCKNICYILFYISFMYIRIYVVLVELFKLFYPNSLIDLLMISPLFILHFIWVYKLHILIKNKIKI
jgi:hypothetical protein